ncbi:Uncharacterized protein SCF082_LOCUS6070 [Durusdinium trenchii]|uniref:Uncharacterized protein n=1 Tax=Durusdinium trenchii TaxID=1381693 RepID=A0ABP0IDA2_9DINO
MEYPLLRAGIEAVKASSPVKKEESKDEKPEVTPDPDTSAATVAKLKQFLEEGMKIHSKKLLIAPTPEGAERQRKDILKTALRFEKLLNERKLASHDQNDSEILADLVQKYNDFKANAAIKRWQVITQNMVDQMMDSFLNGHLNLDALLIAKPPRLTVDHLAMYQDYIGKPLHKMTGEKDKLENLLQAEYSLICAGLANDYKEAVAYNLRKSKVLHVRDQITTGLNLIDKWMERRCLMLCADKGQKDSLSAFARRLLVDASHQFGEMDAQKVHHVGFLDMAKYGRLGMPDINDMAAWSLRVLKQNEEYSMVMCLAPVLAGDGVLNGLRGTLYRAPRGSDLKLQDDNVFCRNQFWNSMSCAPTAPLPLSEYVTPESGVFFSHEQGRSLTDKEDGAQWFSSPATIKSILQACLSKVSTMKNQVCILHHYSMYEGTFEKVAVDMMAELQQDCHLACYSETSSPQLFQFSVGQLKDKLLEDWKQGRNLVGALTPKYISEPDFSDQVAPRLPSLKLCKMTEEGSLQIPQDVRSKWLSDPIPPSPQPEDAERDLGVANPDPVGPQLMEPPSLTEEAFKQKYSSSASTNVTINVGGCNLTATLVDNKLYFSTATKMKLLGASTPNAKPVLLYAGGSWISEDSKARDFLSKDANKGKAVEFRLSSCDDPASELQ